MPQSNGSYVCVSRSSLIELLDLVRSWQHATEAHLRGCPRTTYYISSCSDKCRKALALTGQLTAEEIAELPVSGSEFSRSSVSTY